MRKKIKALAFIALAFFALGLANFAVRILGASLPSEKLINTAHADIPQFTDMSFETGVENIGIPIVELPMCYGCNSFGGFPIGSCEGGAACY